MRNIEREVEFTRLFESMIPKLDKFFYLRLKDAGAFEQSNLLAISHDLILQTGAMLATYLCNAPDPVLCTRKTIRVAAGYIWSEYVKQPKAKSHKPPPLKTAGAKDDTQSIQGQVTWRKNLKLTAKMIKDGYKDNEIAAMLSAQYFLYLRHRHGV